MIESGLERFLRTRPGLKKPLTPVLLAPDRDPWEKQPRESSKAYYVFTVYRDMGFKRGYRTVAQQVARSLTLIRRWGRRWQWLFRVEQYDAYVDQKHRHELEDSRLKMLERHRNLERAIIVKVAARLIGNLPEQIVALNPNDLDAQDVARLSEAAVRIGRLSHELPTEHRKVMGVVQHDAPGLGEIVTRILQDPEATRRVLDLVEQVFGPAGLGPIESGFMGDSRESGPLGDGTPPGAAE